MPDPRELLSTARDRVFLVDASPYIFRAFFALPDSIVTPAGEPANAIYGFASFLIRLLNEESPTHLAVAFDGSLTTSFRNDLYPEYKAKRELPPADLEAQQEGCREIAGALGAVTLIDDRYEADDLIAALVAECEGADVAVVVVSSDKDLSQLVGPRCLLYDLARDDLLGVAEVEKKIGVPPSQVADFLALAGDAVDNIPGVEGIGKKTAVALLQSFGSLEALYDRIDQVDRLSLRGAAGIRRRLERQREQAFLSYELARVRPEAPVGAAGGDLLYRGVDREAWSELCERLGFGQLHDRALTLWS